MFFNKLFQLSGKQVLTFTVSAGILALVGFSLVRWMPQKSINIDELIKKANPETPFLNRVFSDLRLNYDDYLRWHFVISLSPELYKEEIRSHNNMMCRVNQMIKSSQQASDLVNFFQTRYKYNNTAIEGILHSLNTNYPFNETLLEYLDSLPPIKSIDERSTPLLDMKISEFDENVDIIGKLIEFELWRIDNDELKKELRKVETNLNLVVKNLNKPATTKTQIGLMPLKEFLGPFSYILRLYILIQTDLYNIYNTDLSKYHTAKSVLFQYVESLICNCLKEYEENSKNDNKLRN